MRGMRTLACAGAFATMFWGGIACARATPPPEAFAVLPARAPLISPDGSRFALIRGRNGRPAVAIYKTESPNEPPQVVTSDDWIIDGMRWAKNDVLLIYNKKNMALGVRDNRNILRPLADAAAVLLNDHKMVRLSAYGRIEDIDLDDPSFVYAAFGGSLYRMNVRSGGRPETSASGFHARGSQQVVVEQTDRWFLDGHGRVIARLDSDRDVAAHSPVWHGTLKVFDRGSWRPIATYDESVDSGDGVAGLSEDGSAMIRLATDPKATTSIARVDLVSGAETRLFQDPKYDVADDLDDDWTGRVVGYVIDEDMPVYRYFDPKREALQMGLENAFPGLSVHAVSADIAQDKVVVEAVGPKTPPSYYLFDRSTHHATAIAASYPDLDESMLGEVRPYPYTARDGLSIAAYLTLPPDRQPRNLPLVVMPHGGPDLRDDMTFDWLSQFLANRGYAVLKPNFRGSRGYGRAFTEAGLHQWGLKMQDDISDGVKKTIADGIADPRRVCIFGASYGGYAALAGATLTPELYACTISFEGVSDLPDMLGYSKQQFGIDITNGSFWVTRIGDAFSDAARLNATSPALHADRITAPVMLLHSELDITVPIHQSEMMADALERTGKGVVFIRLPGDDHYLSLEETRLQLLQQIENFLAANIGKAEPHASGQPDARTR